MTVRCPGQDQRHWKPEDICYIDCPHCGSEIEFWKDEPVRACPDCAAQVRHPRLDLGCAAWCRYTEECLGTMSAPEPRDHAGTAQQEAIRRAREQLKGRDLAAAAKRGGLQRTDSPELEVALLGTFHRIDATLKVERADGQGTHPVDELLILRYLACASERAIRPLGEQIAFRHLPGGAFYQGALARRTTNLLIDTFGDDVAALERALEGFPTSPFSVHGGVGRRVHAIGPIELTLIYRPGVHDGGHDELPPTVDIVYDRVIGRVFRTDEVAALTTRLCLGLRASQ